MTQIINEILATEDDVIKINEIYEEAIQRAGVTGGRITLIDSLTPGRTHITTNYSCEAFLGINPFINHGFLSPVATRGGYREGSLSDPAERQMTVEIITEKILERIRHNP